MNEGKATPKSEGERTKRLKLPKEITRVKNEALATPSPAYRSNLWTLFRTYQ